MNRERAKELLPIIKAYSEGKTIEYKSITTAWIVVNDPNWDNKVEYRIKLEPKLVPFTFEDNHLFRDKWIKSIDNGLSKIEEIYPNKIFLRDAYYTYEEFLKIFVFEDNTPCGKYIEE